MGHYSQTIPYPFTIRCASVCNDLIFVGTYRNSDVNEVDNCARCLDGNFREIWKTPIEFDPLQITATSKHVFVLTHNFFPGYGILYCLDNSSGEIIWKKRLSDISTTAELLVIGDSLVFFCNQEIVKYAVKNGRKLQAVAHDNGNDYYPQKIQNNSIICRSRFALGKYSLEDLSTEWLVDGFDNPMGFGCDKEHAFVAREQRLMIYDLKNGKQAGQIEADPISYILSDGNHVYFQSEHDNDKRYVVSCFSKKTLKAVWHTEVPISLGNANYSPCLEILTDEVVIARGHCGPVYSLERTTGNIAMLLSEANMPNNRFPSENQPVLFSFLGKLFIPYQRMIYTLPEFPSAFLGTKILDADRQAWL